jgi:flagellar basal-body rod protein FlgF
MDLSDALSTAAGGMRVQSDKLDVIAENLANASTTGYRAHTFEVAAADGGLRSSTASEESQGALRRTGVSTDLALVGPGYFCLATPDGVRYTRDGRFSVDADGYLTSAQGHRVLGSFGAVRFPHGASIDRAGNVMIGKRAFDRLRIAAFDRPLQGGDSSGFFAEMRTVISRSTARVQSGFLEDSGVDAISQMTALITAQRAFEANQKSVQQADETLKRVVTDVPAVRS